MWEARVLPGLVDELVAWLRVDAWELMTAVDGFEGGELYRSFDGPDRVVLITHWRDEAALAEFAGPDWRTEPVIGDADRSFLAGAPHVWHFTAV